MTSKFAGRRKLVVVTGVGMRKGTRVFTNTDSDDHVHYDDAVFKLHAAAGSAIQLSKAGHTIYMIGANEAYLKHIGQELLVGPSHYVAVDLLDRVRVEALAGDIMIKAAEAEA